MGVELIAWGATHNTPAELKDLLVEARVEERRDFMQDCPPQQNTGVSGRQANPGEAQRSTFQGLASLGNRRRIHGGFWQRLETGWGQINRVDA